MEIKRKFEMLVATNRRYIIHQTPIGDEMDCPECGEPMLTAEQAAIILDIKQRRIFQFIEAEAAHFAETEAGAVMICLSSLAKILDDEAQNKKFPMPDKAANAN